MHTKTYKLGKVYGQLTVISTNTIRPHKTIKWLCRCECGVEKYISGVELRGGHVFSCGCQRYLRISESLTRHGEGNKQTPEYRAWTAMKVRCSGHTDQSKRYYLDRGITACDRWQASYEAFLADMGRRPGPRYSLDRRDNDKGYSPDNCRWETKAEQSTNRRNTVWVVVNGHRITASAAAKVAGKTQRSIVNHVRRGHSFEQMLRIWGIP